MKIEALRTPAILLDKDALAHNISLYQKKCDRYNKQLWPMVKTHKSTAIAKLQAEAGATGFLCGTLDECEALCRAGFHTLMYAYPVASEASILRVIDLSKICDFTIRIDSEDAADIINKYAQAANVVLNYTIIIDCGLHRFGVLPEDAVALAEKLKKYPHLRFRGISSHSGEVYAAQRPEDVPLYAEKEAAAMKAAAAYLQDAGFCFNIISTGSTPTYAHNIGDENINIYHPGNYVFHDCIQIANGTCTEKECALTVLATVISHPREDLYIVDAGAKCLGLDQGAHGNTAIIGYGQVKGHPELVISGLSEEVGKLHVTGSTDIKVGDKVEIIPNHSCSTANLTQYFTVVSGGDAVGLMEVDIRGNSRPVLY